jgi:hypothetical protein
VAVEDQSAGTSELCTVLAHKTVYSPTGDIPS